jgi:exonuclease III
MIIKSNTIFFIYTIVIKLRLQYPELCELIKKNDIVCLQETKTDDIDKIDLEGYTFKMKNRKKLVENQAELS